MKSQVDVEPVADNFCEWAESLPFVVERDHGLSPTVRMYAVDCEQLEQRSTWLVLDFVPGSSRPTSIVVLLPRQLAEKAAHSGWGTPYMPVAAERFPSATSCANRVVFQVNQLAGRRHVETLVLGAYRSSIAWT